MFRQHPAERVTVGAGFTQVIVLVLFRPVDSPFRLVHRGSRLGMGQTVFLGKVSNYLLRLLGSEGNEVEPRHPLDGDLPGFRCLSHVGNARHLALVVSGVTDDAALLDQRMLDRDPLSGLLLATRFGPISTGTLSSALGCNVVTVGGTLLGRLRISTLGGLGFGSTSGTGTSARSFLAIAASSLPLASAATSGRRILLLDRFLLGLLTGTLYRILYRRISRVRAFLFAILLGRRRFPLHEIAIVLASRSEQGRCRHHR